MEKDKTSGRQAGDAAVSKLTLTSVAGNLGLSGCKLFAGFAGNSAALVADAVHSLSDLLTTVIAWLGARAASAPADARHPYGHERFESAASLLLGIVLAAAGFGLAWTPLRDLLSGCAASAAPAAPAALAAAALSVAVKEWM